MTAVAEYKDVPVRQKRQTRDQAGAVTEQVEVTLRPRHSGHGVSRWGHALPPPRSQDPFHSPPPIRPQLHHINYEYDLTASSQAFFFFFNLRYLYYYLFTNLEYLVANESALTA